MNNVLEKVQINMPFRMLVDRYLPLVIKERINPEIGFDCFALDMFEKKDFIKVGEMLRDEGLSITFHAPFFDLRPGALDRRIRNVTIERLDQVFELVPYFNPRSVVCHASFDIHYYTANEDLWLENSRDTWRRFLAMATEMGTKIALENVYERDPAILNSLMQSFDNSDHICTCFDTGHFNVYSNAPLHDWMDSLGTYIGEIHLHDNCGTADEHAPIGTGTFPFHELFDILRKKEEPFIITLEPHTEENLRASLENIRKMKLLDYLD